MNGGSMLTVPRRIAGGIAILTLLTAGVGLMGLWQLATLRGDIVKLGSLYVPSVVTLSRLTETNFLALRAVRTALIESDAPKEQAKHHAEFQRHVLDGQALCERYTTLYNDETDERMFLEARAEREDFIAKAGRAIDELQVGRRDSARTILRSEAEPAAQRCLDGFDRVLEYNIAASEAVLAGTRSRAQAGNLSVVSGVAAAVIAGLVFGVGLIRSVGGVLRRLADDLARGGDATAATAARLTGVSRAVAEGCGEQGSAVAETSASLEQMAAMIRSTAENASSAKEMARQASTAAAAGSRTMQEMNDAMRAIAASSAEVAKIVKQIDEIAFQTNILALNAAVEAARAGEAGAGFAVVADEVRSLAQRSAAAARETAERIELAITDSRRGAGSCDRVGESLTEIGAAIAKADALVAEIATAAREQSQGIGQIGAAMAQLDGVTHANSARAEEGAAAAEALAAEAETVRGTVGRLRGLMGMRVREEAAPRPRAVPAPAPVSRAARRVAARIPMPGDHESGVDAEDRHFRDFAPPERETAG